MMSLSDITRLRTGTADDLDAVNAIIESAVMTWNLPERVKRLSMPSYRYDVHDLEHLDVIVAESAAGNLIGVATWEPAESGDTPEQQQGLLLHGLYVDPEFHHRGIGNRLLEAALEAGRQGGFDGLLVKASKDAQRFFAAKGLQRLSVQKTGDYPHRYWFDFTQNGEASLVA